MGRMAVAAIVTLWVIPISIAVNRIVPDPYMDEIFHIPQAQRYCRGDFKTWDPMITTPPGLYYLSLAYVAYLFPGMWFAKGTRSFPELCSTAYLRSTNSVMAVICSVLIYDLIIILRPSLSDKKATVSAVVVALYPLHWFFTFLYYTDVASLTVVLAMYLASLKRQFLASAMLGAFATLLRQTNVVWMVFVAATGAISYVEDICKKYNVNWADYKMEAEEIDEVSDKKSISVTSNLRKRGMGTSKSPTEFPYSRVIYFHPLNDSGLINEIMDVSLKFWHFKSNVLITFFPYIVVFASFITFVVINGGIVLGAKEAHAVSSHFVQLLYFGLAAAAAMAPAHFTFGRALGLCQSLRRNKIVNAFKLVIFMATGLILVHFFSIAHPYLLADNRHYTFYIWRKFIQAHWSTRYLLVPLYLYSWFSLTTALGKAQKKVWVLLLFFASALVLIPPPLIEFRYYTIPFYFLFLNSQIEENMNLAIIGIMYTSVNIITMLVFLFRPFHWDHELGMQRFIW